MKNLTWNDITLISGEDVSIDIMSQVIHAPLTAETEIPTDIKEYIVAIANKAIRKRELSQGIEITVDKIELECNLSLDSETGELMLQEFVIYDKENEGIIHVDTKVDTELSYLCNLLFRTELWRYTTARIQKVIDVSPKQKSKPHVLNDMFWENAKKYMKQPVEAAKYQKGMENGWFVHFSDRAFPPTYEGIKVFATEQEAWAYIDKTKEQYVEKDGKTIPVKEIEYTKPEPVLCFLQDEDCDEAVTLELENSNFLSDESSRYKFLFLEKDSWIILDSDENVSTYNPRSDERSMFQFLNDINSRFYEYDATYVNTDKDEVKNNDDDENAVVG
jgi:hypothetical protein